ncbi:MAG: GTP-binding protein [Catonella sp.]|uniref:GTP-binding protein n=1 Tax=Catonella sp. TaxID=2382125 RepID=UPI003FA08E4A
MIKIDLVTGFLGSGKTTFIKKYAKYFLDKGLKIGILENDYGAINIDLMLLGDLLGENCELEMIIGGGDLLTHKRRFRTKLIAMAMSGYDRVIVEPSGIFEPEELFDLLSEEPLDRWYEVGSVITIVDVSFETELSASSEYLLAVQLASAGAVVFSRQESCKYGNLKETTRYLNSLLAKIKCKRKIGEEDIVPSEQKFEGCDFRRIASKNYVISDYEKQFFEIKDYSSIFIMNSNLTKHQLTEKAKNIFEKSVKFGRVIRIKGFIEENGRYFFINMTKNTMEINSIEKGQNILIIIGEELNEDEIKNEISE